MLLVWKKMKILKYVISESDCSALRDLNIVAHTCHMQMFAQFSFYPLHNLNLQTGRPVDVQTLSDARSQGSALGGERRGRILELN